MSELVDPLLGKVVGGSYRIDRQLGAGGMAVVYEGVHVALERPVAIKVMKMVPGLADEMTPRFLREARVAASIQHECVVEIHDLGRLEDGRPFLVMERLHGEHLAAYLARRPTLDAADVAALLAGPARALDALHAAGIVHRDVKPENLFMTAAPDGRPIVKLLDFGLAAYASGRDRITRLGILVGTPEYLAPELADGSPPDGRADVYSLATVAFELLTGAVPFDSASRISIVVDKLERDAPSLMQTTGRQFTPEIERAFQRGLARQPDRRQPTPSQFVDELRDAAVVARARRWRTSRGQTAA